MMFLEFFIWGGWFVTMGSYLRATAGASGAQIAQAYSTQSWGAIVAPFIFGLIADRYFNAERVLAVIHLVGGALMLALARRPRSPRSSRCSRLHGPVHADTCAGECGRLSPVAGPVREFSRIRVWGTVGWMSAGLCISYVFAWDSPVAIARGSCAIRFICAAQRRCSGLLQPDAADDPADRAPRQPEISDVLGLDAFGLLANRNFLVFFISSVLICIPWRSITRTPISFSPSSSSQRDWQTDAGPGIEGRLHAAYAVFSQACWYEEDDTAGGHAGMGGALHVVRLRECG